MFKYKSGEEIELNDVVKHTGLAIELQRQIEPP